MTIRFKLPGFTSPITRADTPTPGGLHLTRPPGRMLSPPRTTYPPKDYGDLIELPGKALRPLSLSARDGLAHALSAEIWNILVQEVMICHQDGTPQNDDLLRCLTGYQERFYKEKMQLPRLKRIHRLLCGWRDPSNVFVIENGPGQHASSAITIAAMGSNVLIKQPMDDFFQDQNTLHQEVVDDHCSAEVRSNISYATTKNEVSRYSQADIVYWSSPNPELALEYLGRDVTPDGFLVVQTEVPHQIDNKVWRKVFYALLGKKWPRITGLVLPGNALHAWNNFIVLQRRRTP